LTGEAGYSFPTSDFSFSDLFRSQSPLKVKSGYYLNMFKSG
jgi:hypothetical protein